MWVLGCSLIKSIKYEIKTLNKRIKIEMHKSLGGKTNFWLPKTKANKAKQPKISDSFSGTPTDKERAGLNGKQTTYIIRKIATADKVSRLQTELLTLSILLAINFFTVPNAIAK